MKLISCKPHGFSLRKKLTGTEEIFTNYKLLRVRITYQDGKSKEIKTTTSIVYPSDVVPYLRRTLDLIEKVVRERMVGNKSYYQLENVYEPKYGFSLKSIKCSVERVKWAFERLLVAGIIEKLNFESWLKVESRSFAELSRSYRGKFFPDSKLAMQCIFSR